MAGRIEKKEVIYVLFLFGFIFGIIYFYKGQYFMNDMLKASNMQRTTGMVGERTKANQSFQKNIESTLNQLLESVFLEMQEYRKRRVILDDIIKPQNLRDPKYIAESYQIGLQTIPDLRARSNRIIQIFNQKDAEIKGMIQGRTPDAQRNILQSWARVKAEQVDLYVNYFMIEQNALNRYESLLKLYYENRNDVVYNAQAGQVSFKTPALNAKATSYTQDIKGLKAQQVKLTK